MIEASKAGTAAPIATYGMVGGGEGAFIGDVHRKAIALDGRARLTAGCFSRSFPKTLKTGLELHIEKERLYESYTEMAAAEAKRPDGIDFVVVVTPNSSHYAICRAFLEKGINVVCDKPLATDSREAEELDALARKKDLLFGVSYTYSGYPAVKQAKAMIEAGEIGDIRFVNAEYPQEWLADRLEDTENKQASWRTDPAQSGISNCVGDIGSHVENTVSYMTGLRIKRLSARLDTFVEGRSLDDNATIMIDYEGGARGLYWASQVAIGNDNGLAVRVFGSKGTISWRQEDPNYLKVVYSGKPAMVLSRGRDQFAPRPESLVRIPAGHPEGYFEAFANIYLTFIKALVIKAQGGQPGGDDLDFPTASDGAQGVRFIEKCVESSKKDAEWLDF
jgi:predicted dehydrogenase